MSVHFSSKTPEWTTPKDLFWKLDEQFRFTLDPCCTAESALCSNFFTKIEDGLNQSWARERVFMNPPYGREIGFWMQKANEEWKLNKATVVCLVPSRTDTHWWHLYAQPHRVEFLKGRLLFSPNGDRSRRAPFPSALVFMGL